ncbi:MAG: MFS transporter [Anaerolineales bacterium]|nr:MFS transporter [Anaerolineales bacterium]
MTTGPIHKITDFGKRFRSTYREYPNQFWILVFGTFIDRLGGALLFPFFTLYLTSKFGIGMTQVGLIFGMFAISSFFGSMIGGALTDRIGRKSMLLFGLVMSAISSLLMGVVDVLALFFFVTLIVGILTEVGGPAQQAIVADLLPEEQRAEGYGIIRITANLAVAIGPVIGGFLATQSYMLLFISDAVTSLITAVIVYFALKETRRAPAEGEPQQTMTQTFQGYLDVVKDNAFVWFLGVSALMVLVYMQMNTTLAVYLRDIHGVTPQGFGFILSLNAAMVVLFQFPITRRINKYRPLIVMAIGTLLYALGFALYGFVSLFLFFLAAMVIITIGEMLVSPVSQSIVANLGPEDMRGRYMAVYGFSWLVPIAIGPLLAGLVMDNANPDWVWYMAGIIGLVAAGAYYGLQWRVERAREEAIAERLAIMEQLEEAEINAQQASRSLEKVNEGVWARLATPTTAAETRQLRIRVTDQASGTMKSDLHIPVGLANTVLYGKGSLSTELDNYDQDDLKNMIAVSAADKSSQQMDSGDDQIEVSVE